MTILKQVLLESDFNKNFISEDNSISVNNSLSSQSIRNFLNLDEESSEKIDALYEKMVKCGTNFNEYVSSEGEIKALAVYCDNRCCDKDGCKKHRLYKYKKEHKSQIDKLNKSMRKPKGWVFSGWKLAITDLSREFCREKLIFLFNLLKQFSVSEFSIHMEIKVYSKNHKSFGLCYFHFHVVSGGFRDLRFIRKKWGRQVSYEDAIKPKYLGYYVAKYASKTPYFDFEPYRWLYHLLVYKTQMHRFSCKTDEYVKVKSDWINLDLVILEVKRELYRDSYRNPNSKKRYYYPILEPPPKMKFYYESKKPDFRWYNPLPIIERQKKNCFLEDF